ncbi:MAG: class I SAM-dependent methyltransferase [Candidatus Thorarchaeota archaeon]|nr:class I SAM-dependent methyltransferase [Candidatus Thorarchaeota archaeon]
MDGERTPDMFDQWASTYDDIIAAYSDSFPFVGYDSILDRIVELANPQKGMKILDVGIGTGELAKRFVDHDCQVWGLDYSPKMLEIAKKKVPEAHLLEADVRSNWIDKIGTKFDRIVSAYTLHHFDLDEKVKITRNLYRNALVLDGKMGIGDISFRSAEELGKNRIKLGNEWDDTEYYWSADLFRKAMVGEKFNLLYEQISFCGGVYLIDPLHKK